MLRVEMANQDGGIWVPTADSTAPNRYLKGMGKWSCSVLRYRSQDLDLLEKWFETVLDIYKVS